MKLIANRKKRREEKAKRQSKGIIRIEKKNREREREERREG